MQCVFDKIALVFFLFSKNLYPKSIINVSFFPYSNVKMSVGQNRQTARF